MTLEADLGVSVGAVGVVGETSADSWHRISIQRDEIERWGSDRLRLALWVRGFWLRGELSVHGRRLSAL